MSANKLVILFCFSYTVASGQVIEEQIEQSFEDIYADEDGSIEDDNRIEQIEYLKEHPLDLNKASKEELLRYSIPGAHRADRLLAYRKIFGPFLDIYELQAVPGWTVEFIRRYRSCFTVIADPITITSFVSRLKNGKHVLLTRLSSSLLNNSNANNEYVGDQAKLFTRYRYAYRDLLQYGIVLEKDAGEKNFIGGRIADHTSFHFFLRDKGSLRSLALGDYQINMGQGLIQWQGLAFKKSAEVINIKRETPLLMPFNSAGENYFFRGAAISIAKGRYLMTAFGSRRKIDATVAISDSGTNFISSFITGGLHNTSRSLSNRGNINYTSFGTILKWTSARLDVNGNFINHHFSLPVSKRDAPYNLFAFEGNNWWNSSIDWSYTFSNGHAFGEIAFDKNLQMGVMGGSMLSVARNIDLAILYRNINPGFQSVYGNAFTENSTPVNEEGVYLGISARPWAKWRINYYIDIFRFPWLRFQADAPTGGAESLLHLKYILSNNAEFSLRFKTESKEENLRQENIAIDQVEILHRRSFRLDVNQQLDRNWTIKARLELVEARNALERYRGHMQYLDVIFKPNRGKVSVAGRWQVYEVDDFKVRIYSFEQDVSYSYGLKMLNGSGTRLSFKAQWNINQRFSIWVRLAAGINDRRQKTGGLEADREPAQSPELRVQGLYEF